MPLSKGQKIFFISGLVVVVFSSLLLSIQQFRRRLTITPPAKTVSQSTITPSGSVPTQDTDGDGLADSDELFRVGTSVYLKDTDSDGIADGTEVKAGTNPLCPEGKQCGALEGLGNRQSAPNTQANPLILPLPNAVPPSSTEELLKLLGGKATASDLRHFLNQQGARPEDLAAIDDATLLGLYQQSLLQNPPSLPQESPPRGVLPSTTLP